MSDLYRLICDGEWDQHSVKDECFTTVTIEPNDALAVLVDDSVMTRLSGSSLAMI